MRVCTYVSIEAHAQTEVCALEGHLPMYYLCSVGTIGAAEVNDSILDKRKKKNYN